MEIFRQVGRQQATRSSAAVTSRHVYKLDEFFKKRKQFKWCPDDIRDIDRPRRDGLGRHI